MDWFNQPWVWMGAALILGILEILVPGWVFFGFAVGAFFMASMIWLGIGVGLSFGLSLVLFSVLSLLAYIGMRQIFGVRRGQVKIWDRDIND